MHTFLMSDNMPAIPSIIQLIANYHPKNLSDYEAIASSLLNDHCDHLITNEAVALMKILAVQSEEEFFEIYVGDKKTHLSSQIHSIFWRLRNKRCGRLKNKNPTN